MQFAAGATVVVDVVDAVVVDIAVDVDVIEGVFFTVLVEVAVVVDEVQNLLTTAQFFTLFAGPLSPNVELDEYV